MLTFHGVFPDEDLYVLYVKVLEAGVDIVTTADWITAGTVTPIIRTRRESR